jgi:hypothetical protein
MIILKGEAYGGNAHLDGSKCHETVPFKIQQRKNPNFLVGKNGSCRCRKCLQLFSFDSFDKQLKLCYNCIDNKYIQLFNTEKEFSRWNK